jgi:esterase/lipase
MVERKDVSTRFGKISYLDTNEGDRKIVYLHGGFGGPDAIEIVDRYLGQDGWRIIAPCLPGHGRSFKLPDGFSHENLVETISEFINGFTNVDVIIGHSLGGRVAYDLPQNVVQTKARVLFAPILAKIDENFASTVVHVAKDFSEVKPKKGSLDKGDLQTNFRRLKDMQNIWTIIKKLSEVKIKDDNIPTLIMWGKEDSVIKMEANKHIAQNIAGSNFRTYKGGHYWFLNNGLHWNDIRNFIGEVKVVPI